MTDPAWLAYAHEIQAIAQSGLAFDPPVYDRDRYLTLQHIAARMLAAGSGGEPAAFADLFATQAGYATPKIDVRGAVFRGGKILLVREAADHGRWTLPGGWADVGLTPAENVAKEIHEESGFLVRVTKLAAVWDRARQGHTPHPFHAYKLFFLCDITGGTPTTSDETTEIAFFPRDAIPADLSIDRITPTQIARMFDHADDPTRPTDFE